MDLTPNQNSKTKILPAQNGNQVLNEV